MINFNDLLFYKEVTHNNTYCRIKRPTNLSVFVFGGPYNPNFELFRYS